MAMYFVVGLPNSRKSQNVIKVAVDQLTKLAHFLLVNLTCSVNQYARLSREITRLNIVPISIIFYRVSIFTFKF